MEYSSENCNADTETIFTDGPSSEFKNKFMMKLLNQLSLQYNKTFEWKYFATFHGKGVVGCEEQIHLFE